MPFRTSQTTRLLPVFLIVLQFLTACAGAPANPSPTPEPASTRAGTLTPYRPTTVPPTTTQTVWTEPPAIPTPTPTPRMHVVQQGEDMFGIALRYRISLEELKVVNPGVNPNILSIGATLVIPVSQTPAPTDAAAPGSALPSPTPVPLEMGSLRCFQTQEGGAWCSLPVTNRLPAAVEGLIAAFRMADETRQNIILQNAFLPFDRLLPGETLPLVAFFPPPIPAPFEVRAELLTALPSPEDGRYLATQVRRQQMVIAPGGLSARVSVEVRLAGETGSAERLWVVVVAYDAQGSVVGVRRWEAPPGPALASGQVLPVTVTVYSAGGPMVRVDALAEARP